MNCASKELLLYAVTDRSWTGEKTLLRQVEEVLQGGATMVQLREKDLPRNDFLGEARQVQALCRAYGVPFVINDDVELAMELGADGVHVGQSDWEAGQVREKVGPGMLLGVSVHSVEEALLAQSRGADYLGLGAAFVTTTKTDVTPMDHGVLAHICAAVRIPAVAIGGISRENILQLKGLGLAGVAVVSALFAAADIPAATAEMKQLAEEMKDA